MDPTTTETEDEFTATIISDDDWRLLSEYVQQNRTAKNTQLFSILALLNAYIPEAYLEMHECQQILGPPDPIHGGPPFEERMKPFTALITPSVSIPAEYAQRALEQLAACRISRSNIAETFLSSLCGAQTEPYIIEFIKDLLTKREMGEKNKERFSRLILDICERETFLKAVTVMKTASDKFRQEACFPQTLSRLYYIDESNCDYRKAEKWAQTAIARAPRNSFVADTLGQIHKNYLLRRASGQSAIVAKAKEAFKAFKDVEDKAEKEEGSEMADTGVVSHSNFFNNRGLFGFMQVAKILFEKVSEDLRTTLVPKLKMEVEAKFDFFEWYLTYSKPDMTTFEPDYFWKDVTLCYQSYTAKKAGESTSFPGLLDCLNHGLFTSRGKRAGFEEAEKTKSALTTIRDVLKTAYEENADNVNEAERYILSNITLSNKMSNAPQRSLVKELQAIIHKFMGEEVGRRSPEFYLLVLLLFWPEEQLQVTQKDNDEEVEQPLVEDDESMDKTWEDEDTDEDEDPDEDEDTDEEEDTGEEPEQQSPGLTFDPDLEQYAAFMEAAFERVKYAKYLRGRYLLPLFFLGKGSGLSRWIHKSRLDAIVEKKVDAELADKSQKKITKINNMWVNGEVWQVPEIKNILLRVQGEPCHSFTMLQECDEEEVFVCAGGKKIKARKIKARTEVKPDGSALSPMYFYLGFTIRGPVVFKVGVPHNEH